MAIIGIDLGTSNSAASVLRGGRPVIIPSSEGISLGGKAFPSFVAITADGQTLVGEPARRQAAANPEGTATAFKRKMGHRDKIKLRDKEFSPEQLSAFLLQKIKRDAEAFLDPLTPNKLPNLGRIALTHLLNSRGRIELGHAAQGGRHQQEGGVR